jgi:hypothetical protein
MAKKLTTGGHMFGPLNSPMAASQHGLIRKSPLRPKIAANTMRTDIKTGAASVRSAQTAGKIIKPF